MVGPLADLAGRAVADEVFQRLADHPEPVLDGQLDQVGIASGQTFAEREIERLIPDR